MQEKRVTEISIMMINLETAFGAAGPGSLAPLHMCYAACSSSLCPSAGPLGVRMQRQGCGYGTNRPWGGWKVPHTHTDNWQRHIAGNSATRPTRIWKAKYTEDNKYSKTIALKEKDHTQQTKS